MNEKKKKIIANVHKLFILLYSSAIGGGELFSGDDSDGLFQVAFEGSLSQVDVGQWNLMLSSCFFSLGRSKKSA
jgi:hypothetical protein